MYVETLHHTSALRGRTKPHLVLCEDGYLYVVKTAWNPLGERALICDYFVTQLARLVGLPVPECRIIRIDPFLLGSTPAFKDDCAAIDAWRRQHSEGSRALHYGSRFVSQPWNLPPLGLDQETEDAGIFAGSLALDCLCCSAGRRQALFTRSEGFSSYRATFIDFSRSFSDLLWANPFHATQSLFPHRRVYATVRGYEDFEPYLSRLTTIRTDELQRIGQEIPPIWYEHSPSLLDSLVESVAMRRSKIVDVLWDIREHKPESFPAWKPTVSSSARVRSELPLAHAALRI